MSASTTGIHEGSLITQRIERQAAAAPESIATTCEGVSLTYRELNRRANQLAHRLRQLGAGPESLVAIGLERSNEMVVGLLGILKSGAAYLPIDLAYPQDRLEFTLQDAGAKIMLTSRSARESLPVTTDSILLLDAAWSEFATQPEHDPEQLATLESLAYVIYTSGSTGKPKGCQVTHANVARLFTATEAWFEFDASDVWTFFHSHAFDFSVWEIWGALVHGGRVVVVPYAVSRSPEAFHALLVSEGVTVLNQTPTAFRSLIHADLTSTLPASALSLRTIIFGGEALELQMLRPWFERHGDQHPRLVNMYGITETTVHVTYRPIALEDVERNAGSVIGVPIPDLGLVVLDESLKPVAMDVVGEMYVSGAGVSRGYLNRPELTAERFIVWQSPDGESMRLYKTGDLARWLADGDLEYLGRIDHQVKIRGFRIETGEIESVLAGHAGVRDCAVIARNDGAGGEARLVAYVVPSAERTTHAALWGHLSAALPEFMVPTSFVDLDALPLTENGKLDRKALPAPERRRPELAGEYEAPAGDAETRICGIFASVLELDRAGRNDNFFALGGSSLLAVRALERFKAEGLGNIATTVFFRDPTAAALANALGGRQDSGIERTRFTRRKKQAADAGSEPIAIIAMAGRFPGAADVETLWRNLCDGQDSIRFFNPGEIDQAVPQALRDDPAYVRARGVMEGVEQFDAAFFGISPREAELMDPQQRIFLELCWECIERAGHVPDATAGPVGVFAGMFNASYFQNHVVPRPDLVERVGAFQVMLNNEKDFIATRVAHKLNLTGPAISVHTACSTSLVAIVQALDSLRAGQCDMALAGGITVTCPPNSGYLYQEGAMLSADGHTRTFDADAQGTVFSDGGAVVLLKRLSDALEDGNPVYAVLRGGAINNDGATKASFTAPSSEGQAAVIAMAHENAGVSPRDISYVEAHGTATPLGDPIEIEGLTKAFRRGTMDTGFCRIGSVKSNVGHLVIAAGATGVIKTALALNERRIPATVHFSRPNPSIDFASTPFVVNGSLSEWTSTDGGPLRAGVSSFGVGGTNAHVVMEEAPPLPLSEPAAGPQLLVLSARTPAALVQASARLADHLECNPDANLADVAWTLATGRKSFAHRLAVAAGDGADAIAQLRSPESASAVLRSRPVRPGGVVFMFPGQGSQYAGMGRALYAEEPMFRQALDECAEGLFAELRFDLRDVVFGDDAEALLPTSVMQPAIFSLEYSLARLWMGYGVMPVAMVGHSVGEFVAATLSGVFTLGDALKLVARRGRLMQAQPPGGMLSVRMSSDVLRDRLPSELSLAAENSPSACVVSGPQGAIERFQTQLEADGVACRALHTSHAFHSAMMDPVVDVFRTEVESVPRLAPRLPLVSTATGEWLDADSAMSADYWARHLREPVRFATALGKLIDASRSVLLEVGSRTTLTALARQQPALRQHQVSAVPTLSDAVESEVRSFRQAVGQLWSHGAPLEPSLFDRRTSRRRVLLPTYPFERQRHWVEATPASGPSVMPHPLVAANSVLEKPELHLVTALDKKELAGAGNLRLVSRIRDVFEDAAGFPMAAADTNFIELGLDSLVLTQIALRLQKAFGVKVTFRQLMGECATLNQVAEKIEGELPAEEAVVATTALPSAQAASVAPAVSGVPISAAGDYTRQVVDQQMALMQKQLALLDGSALGEGSAAALEFRRQVIQQQQAVMAQQLALLTGIAPAATANAPGESQHATAPDVSDAVEEAATMRNVTRPHGVMDARYPVVPGARLGRDPEGHPAWFVANPERPGKFLKVGG